VSTYEIGAFEALEWAWNMLRTGDSRDLDDVTRSIQDMLSLLGSGSEIDFHKKTMEVKGIS
jgi:hypothetical protein